MIPEFHEHKQSENEEVTEGFYNVVKKIAILHQVRMELHINGPQWKARVEFIMHNPANLALFDKFPTYPLASEPTRSAISASESTHSLPYTATRKARFRARG